MRKAKARFQDALWRQRRRKWYIVCANDDGSPVVIDTASGQRLAVAIWRECRRRQRKGAA